MDPFIIFAAKFLGYVVILGLLGLALYGCLYVWYRNLRSLVGSPVVVDAIREYRKTHPHKFKSFDKLPKDDV